MSIAEVDVFSGDGANAAPVISLALGGLTREEMAIAGEISVAVFAAALVVVIGGYVETLLYVHSVAVVAVADYAVVVAAAAVVVAVVAHCEDGIAVVVIAVIVSETVGYVEYYVHGLRDQSLSWAVVSALETAESR